MKSSFVLTLLFAPTAVSAATACIEEGYDPLRGEPRSVLFQGARGLPAANPGLPLGSDIDDPQGLFDRGAGFQRPLQ